MTLDMAAEGATSEGSTSGPRRRVALYGGSFDPPHQCHVLVATWVLCRGGVDEVRVLPALGHAFGKQLTPFAVRCEMIAEAVRHLGPSVKVEPIEGRLPVPSYTIDTVRALLAEEDIELTLVMGADAYADRERWKEWPELERLIGGRVLVVGRGDQRRPRFEAAHGDRDAPNEVFALPDLSSTDIRRRVREGESYWWMVPVGVKAIIEREALYR